MADNQPIFSDKIKLASVLISKEMNMIFQVNSLKSALKSGRVDMARIDEDPFYKWSWQNISELYDFLKFSYLDKLEKTDKENIEAIMKSYNNLNTKLTYEQLIQANDYILKMMAATGFHSVDINFKSSRSLMDPTQKW